VHLGTAQKAVLRGHEEAVLSMSYSPDGARIASGSFDQTVRVWDARSGESLEVIRGHGDVGAIAASAARFPYRALAREQETIVEDAASGDVVARSSESLSDIFTDPSGRSWAGGVGSCLCLLRLEGGQR
jgi:WD40 repeat protein